MSVNISLFDPLYLTSYVGNLGLQPVTPSINTDDNTDEIIKFFKIKTDLNFVILII